MLSRIIIDGDACPVVSLIVDLTEDTGISVLIMRNLHHFSSQHYPAHVETRYVDDGPDAVDYKIVQYARPTDLVVTQDYGLAQLLIDRVYAVLHHTGMRYTQTNLSTLLAQRHQNALMRKNGGRHKGPAPFTKADAQHFEDVLRTYIEQRNV